MAVSLEGTPGAPGSDSCAWNLCAFWRVASDAGRHRCTGLQEGRRQSANANNLRASTRAGWFVSTVFAKCVAADSNAA
jgi:hypothetical protein